MTQDRHAKISTLFASALEQPPELREAWLREACGGDEALFSEVRELLAHDRDSFDMLDAAAEHAETQAEQSSAERGPPGTPDIPGYRIRRLIGQGGMGTVFEAEQQSPKRRVAIKVILPHLTSPALIKRFAQEAHVLAQLQHEGIARIYDAGQDATRAAAPYFVMEYLEGAPLTNYVEANDLAIQDRLRLFTRVCDAIQYAHQKGVIHRDIKPANILVTSEGQPKVLDFGIARVTDEDMRAVTLQTDVGQVVGTLSHMSPEQASGDLGDLDTRSDVYSLGVVLYELLGGRLPCDMTGVSMAEAVLRIQTVDPPRLGTIESRCRGDLEVIVHKALEKERHRRYASADQFAADIRRYLNDEPITARPASAMYQIRKFTRRNKALVAGGIVAALALIVGAAFSIWFGIHEGRAKNLAKKEAERANEEADRANEQARRATLEAQTSTRFVNFVMGTLRQIDPNLTGLEEPTLRSAMDAMAANIEAQLADEPTLQGRMHAFLGNMYRSLGRVDQSQEHLDRAIEVYRDLGQPSLEAAEALQWSAFLHFKRYQLDTAEELAREARRTLETLGETGGTRYGDVLMMLAEIALKQRRDALARQYIEACLGLRRAIHEEDHEGTAVALLVRGDVLREQGDYVGAEASVLESLEMRRRLYSGDHPLVAESLNNLSLILYQRNDTEGAARLLREAVEMRRNTLPSDHPAQASGILNLAVLELSGGKPGLALTLLEEAERLTEAAYGLDHPRMGHIHMRQAMAHSAMGSYGEAAARYRLAIPIFERTQADPSDLYALNLQLADALGNLQQGDEAFETLKEALANLRRSRPEPARLIHLLDMLVYTGRAIGREEEIRDFERELETLRTDK